MVIWQSFRICSNVEGFEIDIDTVEHGVKCICLTAALLVSHQVKYGNNFEIHKNIYARDLLEQSDRRTVH